MTTTTQHTMDLTAIMDGLQDKAMLHLPLESISARNGFNPRRYFAPDKLNELVESIKAQGVIQPIVVKPNEEKTLFHLIAGERRFRAATEAGIGSIPVIVRLINDEDALAIAVSENSEREDVSAAEESRACHRMMALLKGDKIEVALALGWTTRKLESRLLLLHCSEQVLDMLEQRKISIGHAELLAGLTHEMQDQTLVGIMAKNVPVATLRESLGRYAYKMADAVFNTTECAGCPHNSSQASDLFDNSLGDGHCMKRECYDGKTQAHLTQKTKDLAEQYPVIWMDVEKPADTRCFLVRDGANGVGQEQFTACQGCANFGVLMNTGKGNEGKIEDNVCFDMACNSKMVKAHQNDIAKPAVLQGSSTSSVMPSKPISLNPKPTVTKNHSETPKRVMTFVNDKQCAASVNEVINNTSMVKIFSLLALASAVGSSREDTILNPILKKHKLEILRRHFDRADMVVTLSKLDDASINELIRAYTATMAGCIKDSSTDSEAVKTAQAVLRITNADMKQYFTVDKAFLDTFTIGGLKALLLEAGFIKWYDDAHKDGDCEKTILSGKRDEQIKAVLDADFDWTGFVPKVAQLP